MLPIFLSLFLMPFTYSNVDSDAYLTKRIEFIEIDLSKVLSNYDQFKNMLEENELTLKTLAQKIELLQAKTLEQQNEISKYDQRLQTVIAEQQRLESKYDFRLLKPERKYLKCLSNHVVALRYSTTSENAIKGLKYCQQMVQNYTDPDVRTLQESIKYFLKSSKDQLNLEREKNQKILYQYRSNYHQALSAPTHLWKNDLAQLGLKKNQLQMEQQDLKLFQENFAKYMDCEQPGLEINLESPEWYPGSNLPGILYNRSRDDQQIFMVGTCYAHFTKDSITAITEGKITPSFLDIAYLNFNLLKQDNDINSGGNPCMVLEKIKEIGICDYKKSPLELIYDSNRSQDNAQTNSVKNELQNLWIDLNEFDELKKKFPKLSEDESHDFLKGWFALNIEGEAGINVLIEEPASNFLFEEWERKQLYHTLLWKNPKHPLLKESHFLVPLVNSWVHAFDLKLSTTYFGPIIKQCALPREISELSSEQTEKCAQIFHQVAAEFTSYLEAKLTAENLPSANLNIDSNYRLNIFLQTVYKKAWFQKIQFLNQWIEANSASAAFLSNSSLFGYASVAEKIKKNLSNIEKRLNLDFSEFKASFENLSQNLDNKSDFLKLMAPKCMDPSARYKIPGILSCTHKWNPYLYESLEVSESKQTKTFHFRFTVLSSLLLNRGTPVGNVHQFHVNSIVGMRFNEQKKSCEYSIRESNGAITYWMNEDELLKQNESFMIFKRREDSKIEPLTTAPLASI